MKVNQIILTERISLTRFIPSISNTVKYAIFICISEYIDNISEEDIHLIIKQTKDYLKKTLPVKLESLLSKTANEILMPDLDKSQEITIGIIYSNTRQGYATSDNFVMLNKKLVTNLIESTADIFGDFALDNYDLISNKIKFLDTFKNYLYSWRFDNPDILELSSVFVHELVHVQQFIQQHNKDIQDTQYRSYLQKSAKHFKEVMSKDDLSAEFYKLHSSSPQEITALAHNVALKIMSDFNYHNAKSIEDIEELEADTIQHYIDDFIKNRLGHMPETPIEKKVYKRYIKQVYLEIQSYIKHLEESKDAN